MLFEWGESCHLIQCAIRTLSVVVEWLVIHNLAAVIERYESMLIDPRGESGPLNLRKIKEKTVRFSTYGESENNAGEIKISAPRISVQN